MTRGGECQLKKEGKGTSKRSGDRSVWGVDLFLAFVFILFYLQVGRYSRERRDKGSQGRGEGTGNWRGERRSTSGIDRYGE